MGYSEMHNVSESQKNLETKEKVTEDNIDPTIKHWKIRHWKYILLMASSTSDEMQWKEMELLSKKSDLELELRVRGGASIETRPEKMGGGYFETQELLYFLSCWRVNIY